MNNSVQPIIKLFKHLSLKRKKQLFFTFLVMVFSGITELIAINSVIPLLAAITNPEKLSQLNLSKLIAKLLNIQLNEDIIYPFIIFFAISVIFSAVFRLLSLSLTFKMAALVGTDMSIKTFSNNIYQPYEFHLNNSSSKLIAANTTFINNTVTAFLSFLTFIYNTILTIIISTGLFFINTRLTIYSLIIFSIVYLFIGKKFQKIVKKNSQKILKANESLIKSLQESLGSIRNVLLESNQRLYIENFKKYDWDIRSVAAKNSLISETPRYVIESLALLLIALALLFIMRDLEKNSQIIISIGAFTLGTLKLLPAFQKIYQTYNQFRAYSSDVENTNRILEMKVIQKTNNKINIFKLKKTIRFDSVCFSYNQEKSIISDLNLEILKGQRIGIIGKTGSGKTTIADLLMGLLKPTKGFIYVDDQNIHDKKNPNLLYSWRRSISHVPQNIFLTETTIAENIAFGIDKSKISIKRVKECAKKAQIHEFIESTSKGYLTTVGERGIRLSGGQLQRIAIARALYKGSEILIFDEATSALDNKTEIELMRAIDELSNQLTIISIAHRHSTIKTYDRIIKVEKGYIYEINRDSLIT